MAQRRSAVRRLNSSCWPVTAATGGNQVEERAAHVARSSRRSLPPGRMRRPLID